MATQAFRRPRIGVRPLADVADELGLRLEEWEPYGAQIAKLDLRILERVASRPQGRYVVVTTTTPTPAGEGKTVVSIGLSEALRRLGHRATVTLRQPALGPYFGRTGGATGGGAASLVPDRRINVHFTGDGHAVSSAHNLLMAMLENHMHRGNALGLDAERLLWRRVIDVNDRTLRQVVTGLGGRSNGLPRETGFEITGASEVMGILALSDSARDMRLRLAEISVAQDRHGRLVRAEQLRAAGAMAHLLQDALRPNLVQTTEGGPCLVHAGPYADMSVGCNSVIADRVALGLSDFVITEVGLGADCGAEKLVHIKCAAAELRPALAVLVTTVRSLKGHAGIDARHAAASVDVEAVHAGCGNLAHHISILRHFGLPVVVAVNRFPGDTDEEIGVVLDEADKEGALAAVTVDVFARGGEGGMELARAVAEHSGRAPELHPCYAVDDPVVDKLAAVARKIYGAGEVLLLPAAEAALEVIERHNLGHLPVCIAKTPLSLSDDAHLRGTPRGFTLPITDLRPASGAGYITALTRFVTALPGLPERPAAGLLDLA